MKFLRFSILPCFFLLVFSLASQAAAVPAWKIIPEESQLIFTATQNGVAVTADFKKIQGLILFDLKQLKESKIEIFVDVKSLESSYAEVKKLLLGADWLDVEKYPYMKYTCTQFTKIDSENFEANGMLTIRDKTLPVVLKFKAEEKEPGKMLVSGNTQVNRLDFGVGQGEWRDTSSIKNEVQINFRVQLLRE